MINESIFSEQFKAGNRTYFFDIKESVNKKRYLSITESKKSGDEFERFRIMIYEEDIELFSKYFNSSLLKFFKTKETKKDISYQESVKFRHPNAYLPWDKETDEELELLYCQGKSVKELSEHFKRNIGGIKSRINKLELPDKYPQIR